jgi:hypothetical protein
MRERQLLGDDRRVAEVAICAAELLGQVEAEQPGIAHLVPELPVDLVVLRPPVLVRSGFLAQKLGDVLSQFAMLVGLPGRAVGGEQL